MVDLVGPIQHKRGTTAAWATSQIPLRDGEIGIDTTTRRIKVGDGSTLFPGLPWVSSDAATIQRLEELATEIEGAVTPTDAAMAAAAGLPNGAFAGALSTKIADAIDEAGLAAVFSGRVALFIGDSITAGSNATNTSTFGYPAVVQQICGSAAVVPVVSGNPGERADQIVGKLAAALDANPNVQHVHVQVGTNDAQQGRTLAQFQASIIEFDSIAKSRGKTVSFGLIPPRAASATAADALLRLFNLWLSQWARQNGRLVADTFGALADPTTGFLRSDYDADGIHPNNDGHRALARAVAPVVVGKAVPYVSRDFLASPLGLVANPLMANTTGWVVRSGSVTSRSIVQREAGDGLRYGAWHRILKDNSGGGSAATVVVAHDLDTTKFSAGDTLLVHARLNHLGTAGGVSYVSLVDGVSSFSYPGRAPSEIAIPGEILRTVVVPATFTTLRVAHQLSVPAGGILDSHLGECQVINLTRGQLADAF